MKSYNKLNKLTFNILKINYMCVCIRMLSYGKDWNVPYTLYTKNQGISKLETILKIM